MKKNKEQKKIKEIQENIVIDDIDSSEDELRELTELVGDGEYKVSVYKLSDDRTQWEKIGVFPIDQFNPDEVAKTYNGGKFKFRVMDGSGKFVRQITVPYAKKEGQKDEQKNNNVELLEFIKTELSSRDLLLAKLIENLKPVSIPQNNLSELITALSTLKTLQKPEIDFNNILNILKMGMNITKELSYENSSIPVEEKFINAILDKLLPNLTGLLGGSVSRKPLQNAGNTPLTLPQKTQNGKNEIKTNMYYITPFEKDLIENLKLYEPIIMKMSTSVDNIPKVGNSILGMLSDDDIVNLQNYLNEYNYYRIINFIPNFASIRDWLKGLVEYILSQINEMTIDETDETDEIDETDEVDETDEINENDKNAKVNDEQV